MKLAKQMMMVPMIVAALGMTACGGGGSDSGSASSTSGKYVRGSITAFGSVYVNGLRYNTDGASVYIDDNSASESELRVGMTVTMSESSPGVVNAIYYDDDVEGVVFANTVATNGQMNVMGQTVTVSNTTIFESYVAGITSVNGIAAGHVVEVTGSPSGDGSFAASRIEVKATSLANYLSAPGNYLEVKGIVANHAGSSFTIGGLTINYSGSTDTSDMLAGNWNGLYVEAKSDNVDVATSSMNATKVEREDDHMSGSSDDEVEVKGTVSALTGSSITVNGIEFLRDANTLYELKGQTLAVGLLVEVDGRFNSAGQLVAREVDYEDEDHGVGFYGVVAAISRTDTNTGTVTVGGVVYTVTNSTIMYDDRDDGVNNFNLSMLVVGNNVELYVDGANNVTKLERK